MLNKSIVIGFVYIMIYLLKTNEQIIRHFRIPEYTRVVQKVRSQHFKKCINVNSIWLNMTYISPAPPHPKAVLEIVFFSEN